MNEMKIAHKKSEIKKNSLGETENALQISHCYYLKYKCSQHNTTLDVWQRPAIFPSLAVSFTLPFFEHARPAQVHHPATNYYIISFKNYYSNILDTL